MMTDAEVKAHEERVAKLLQQMEEFFDESGDFKKIDDRIKAVEALLRDTEGTSLIADKAGVAEEFEKLRAQNERILRAIRGSKRGGYFPGIEDEGKNFSLLKTCIAAKSHNWDNAGFERELIKTSMDAREKATGQAVSDLDRGGAFIADQLIPDVIGAIYTMSAFIAMDGDGQTRITVLDGLPGGRVTIPQFHGGMIAYWVGEEDPLTVGTVHTGDVHMDLKKIGLLARLTDTMIKYASHGFETLLRADMSKAIVRKLDWTIPFGSGGNNTPLGIVNWKNGGHREAGQDLSGNNVGPGVKVFHAGGAGDGVSLTYAEAEALSAGAGFAGGELSFDGLSLMKLMFEEDDVDPSSRNFATISCPRYWDRLKRIKVENFSTQTSGFPFLVGIPFLPDSRLTELIGPLGKMNQIRSNGTPGSAGSSTGLFAGANTDEKYTGVFMGDFSEFLLGRGSGIEIEDDGGKGTGFSTDSTFLKMRMYADTLIRQPRAIGFAPDVQVRD